MEKENEISLNEIYWEYYPIIIDVKSNLTEETENNIEINNKIIYNF